MGAPDIAVHRVNDSLFLGTRNGIEVCRATVAVSPGVWEFYSTVTRPEYEGRGYASSVVEYALEAAAAAGVRVIPSCWYVDGMIDRLSPKYDHLRAGSVAAARASGAACRIAPGAVRGTPHHP